jgi:hypothetical protein
MAIDAACAEGSSRMIDGPGATLLFEDHFLLLGAGLPLAFLVASLVAHRRR